MDSLHQLPGGSINNPKPLAFDRRLSDLFFLWLASFGVLRNLWNEIKRIAAQKIVLNFFVFGGESAPNGLQKQHFAKTTKVMDSRTHTATHKSSKCAYIGTENSIPLVERTVRNFWLARAKIFIGNFRPQHWKARVQAGAEAEALALTYKVRAKRIPKCFMCICCQLQSILLQNGILQFSLVAVAGLEPVACAALIFNLNKKQQQNFMRLYIYFGFGSFCCCCLVGLIVSIIFSVYVVVGALAAAITTTRRNSFIFIMMNFIFYTHFMTSLCVPNADRLL